MYFIACTLVFLLKRPGQLHSPVHKDLLYVYEISDLLDIDWTLGLLYVILVLLPTVLHANRRSSRSPDHPCRCSLWRLIKSRRWCCGLWKAVLHYGTVHSRGQPLFCPKLKAQVTEFNLVLFDYDFYISWSRVLGVFFIYISILKWNVKYIHSRVRNLYYERREYNLTSWTLMKLHVSFTFQMTLKGWQVGRMFY